MQSGVPMGASLAQNSNRSSRSTNVKSRGNPNTVAVPKAPTKGKSADPVFLACTYRRKTLKDYNKVMTMLPLASTAGQKALDEAHDTHHVVYDFVV